MQILRMESFIRYFANTQKIFLSKSSPKINLPPRWPTRSTMRTSGAQSCNRWWATYQRWESKLWCLIMIIHLMEVGSIVFDDGDTYYLQWRSCWCGNGDNGDMITGGGYGKWKRTSYWGDSACQQPQYKQWWLWGKDILWWWPLITFEVAIF